MKRNLIAVAGAALLAATGLGAVTQGAAAADSQAPIILVLSRAQILQQSKAGQSIGPQMEKLQKEASDDFNSQVESLSKEEDDLKKQKDLMAQDVWTGKAKALAEKEQDLPAVRDKKVRELQISQQKAYGVINEAAEPIIQKIVKDRDATVLLDDSDGTVLFASPETDITAQVIAELDKKLTNVTVEKISLDELQKQAAEAAAKDKKKKK